VLPRLLLSAWLVDAAALPGRIVLLVPLGGVVWLRVPAGEAQLRMRVLLPGRLRSSDPVCRGLLLGTGLDELHDLPCGKLLFRHLRAAQSVPPRHLQHGRLSCVQAVHLRLLLSRWRG